MTKRKPKPRCIRTPTILDQLANHVVDRRDVVGVDGMAKSEDPGQQGCSKQNRMAMEGGEGPGPGAEIKSNQRPKQSDGSKRQSPMPPSSGS